MTAPLRTQPGFTRALTAVRGAEIGLLRAVALDLVGVGGDDALHGLSSEAIELMRVATGPTSVTLQAHGTADGRALTFLGRAAHGIAVSAHLSVVVGRRPELLRATVRLVGTHGSVLVDLLRPVLDVRTVGATTRMPFGPPGPDAASPEMPSALSEIADSARSGRTVSITW